MTSHKIIGGSTFSARGRYLPSASLLRDTAPKLDYLRNKNRGSGNGRNKIGSIAKLPVGATIPIEELNAKSSSSSYSKRRKDLSEVNKNKVPLGRGLIWKPLSPEFINCVVALFTYAIR